MATIINGRGRVGVRTSVGPGGGGGGYGSLTTAWISATGESDATILGALNTLETDLNTYGLTSKMKALYPFVGGTAAKHKFNFMNAQDTDAAFRLTFSGGWTHSSTGALPNGTNGYATTYLNPSSHLPLDSSNISVYSRTNNSNNECALAVDPSFQLFLPYLNSYWLTLNNRGPLTQTSTGTTGLISGDKTSTTLSIYKNGVSVVNAATPTSPNTNGIILIAARQGAFFLSKELAMVTIGSSLSSTEAANFYTAVQAFQTTLGRQV